MSDDRAPFSADGVGGLSMGREEHLKGPSGHQTLVPEFQKCFQVSGEAATR